MTKIGFDWIIDCVKKMEFKIPDTMTLEELKAWVAGAEYCRNTILTMLDEIGRDQRDC